MLKNIFQIFLRISKSLMLFLKPIIKPRGFRFGILYGLCKVRKQLVDNCSPFRPIMSAIKTSTNNMAKFLVPLLEPITTNMYAVENSFEFAKEFASGTRTFHDQSECRIPLYQHAVKREYKCML